jgi:DNA-binding NarL/FixJ family response regulator
VRAKLFDHPADTGFLVVTARILLVDHHPIVLAGLQALIHESKDLALIGQAVSGGPALAILRELRPDVVVMEMDLPGTNGIVLVVRILEFAPDTAIVMLTESTQPVFVKKALQAGIRGYVLKTSASDKILQAIRTALGGGVYIDSDLHEFRSEWRGRARLEPHPHKVAVGPPLTEREYEVLRMAAVGHSNKSIAHSLGLSIKSVETYRFRACTKLSLQSRVDIIRYAASHGWTVNQ